MVQSKRNAAKRAVPVGSEPWEQGMEPEAALKHLFKVVRGSRLVDDLNHHQKRRLAGALGLFTSIEAADVWTRLKIIANKGLEEIKRVKPEWFRGFVYNVYRHRPDQLPEWAPFQLDDTMISKVFQRWGGRRDAESAWARDGNLTIKMLLPHLEEAYRQGLIHYELRMHEHHYNPPPGKPKKGWNRIMVHSAIQQVMRMDPVLYALTVAMRPDHCHRLMPCAYLAKFATNLGEDNSFLHLDLDLKGHVEEGKPANLLTCGVSLTNEDDQNCTVVIPGIHRRLPELVAYMREKGHINTASTMTTDFKWWNKEASEKFGYKTPSPVPVLGARFSRLTTVHGSSGTATKVRATLLPWFVAYGEDYDKCLDAPTGLTWAEQHACHRDCLPATIEPTGKRPIVTIPQERFPAWITFIPPYPLGQAIMGYRKYEDPEVQKDLKRLFHEDRKVAQGFVRHTRRLILRQYHCLIAKVKEAEAQYFGVNSYHYQYTGHDGQEDDLPAAWPNRDVPEQGWGTSLKSAAHEHPPWQEEDRDRYEQEPVDFSRFKWRHVRSYEPMEGSDYDSQDSDGYWSDKVKEVEESKLKWARQRDAWVTRIKAEKDAKRKGKGKAVDYQQDGSEEQDEEEGDEERSYEEEGDDEEEGDQEEEGDEEDDEERVGMEFDNE